MSLDAFKDDLSVALRHAAARTEPRRRRRVLPVAAVALAASAAVALVVAVGVREAAPASAAELLRRAASAISAEPRGVYLRWRVYARGQGTTIQERWLKADGTGRLVVRTPGGRVLERDALRPVPPPDADALVRENPGFDPAQLRAFAAYETLRDTLDSPAAASMRADAYRRLAAAPGLRRLGSGTVAVRVGDVELRLTVDPRTGDLLRIERRLLRRSRQLPGPPGIVNEAVLLRRAQLAGG